MIGFYDSGLGGLTILKEVVELSPATALYYYGDTKNCPLGEKSDNQILEAAQEGVSFLFDQGCSLVVLACNTATAVAIRKLQNKWNSHHQSKNILGIVRPVSEELLAKHLAKDSNIALMATEATIRTKFYEEELKDAGYTNIVNVPCSGLAKAIENNNIHHQSKLLQSYFQKIDSTNIDAIILACTHYPIIRENIFKHFVGAGGKLAVTMFSQNDFIPSKLIDYLIKHPEYRLDGQGVKIFCNGSAHEFEEKIRKMFGIKTVVESIEKVACI